MKLFDKITKDLDMNIFLLQHDSLYKKMTGSLLLLWLSIGGAIWGLDFDKLSPLLKVQSQDIPLLRILALIAITVICLSALVIVNLCFYKKWKKIDDLSPEELKIFNEYFKVPSVYEKRGVQVF